MAAPIQFCTTSDGVRIAYTVTGDGPPLVKVMGFVTNVELDDDPIAFPATRIGLVEGFSLIRFDKRGTGLSDRSVTDFSVPTRVLDLEAVVGALDLEQFYLLGISEGGPIAMTYAAAHPQKVIKLALYGTTAYGGGENPAAAALAALTRVEWGLGSDAMSGLFAPSASAEERAYLARHQLASATAEGAAAMIEVGQFTDVRSLLPEISAPTIVIHARGDRVMPFEGGRAIASGIRDARLVPLESDRHGPSSEGLEEINGLIRDFFGGDALLHGAAVQPERALRAVIFTDLVGHTEMMRRLGDDRGRDVLREHERIIRDLLKQHGGAEVKTMGDGFMASFASVTRAMDCAIALQRAFAARPGEPLHVRVGLNAGEPIEEDGDLFGATVILASRIAAQAGAGEILVPDTVRGLLSGKGFMFSDRGEFVPKGFDEGVRLWDVRWRE